ncbi:MULTISPECIES: hypothetical protein [Flavobacterium]|uniref:Uncharacterized protein n=2 Tax=Flavobacterium TaxID=237 RepID=A0A1M6J6M4_9FLAO|nr:MULTISPECIES: hypothetical protein [Flavobacterium]BCY28361.1 hypothetical protein KK2020170_12290 [Flavobacterium okayamense]SHJ42295.1 hypothetical protein SAMN05444337_1983 [Flavobacterium haoranii]
MLEFIHINYKIVEPIINQILFDKFDEPKFENGKADLCKGFLDTKKNTKADFTLVETYINDHSESILKDFDLNDRYTVIQIILSNDAFIGTMIYDVQHGVSNYDINYISAIRNGIMDKIAEYYTQNDVNYFVKKFFAIFLSDLFLTNFINDSEITENEYLDILSQCTRDKTLV